MRRDLPVDAFDDLVEHVIAECDNADLVQSVLGLGGAGNDPRRFAEVQLTAARQRVDGRRAPFVAVEMLHQLEAAVALEVIMAQKKLRSRARFASSTTLHNFFTFFKFS